MKRETRKSASRFNPKPEDESEKGLTGVDLLAYKIRKIQSILRKWSVK